MSLTQLKKKNPDLKIRSIEDAGFSRYGSIVSQYNFSELISEMESIPVPDDDVIYIADVEGTGDLEISRLLSKEFYGEMPIQIGFCGGSNLSLNALEWHKGSELIIAMTDCILMLACLQDMEGYSLDSSKVQTFYLKQGQAVELYGTTLHFAPCKVNGNGFRAVIILPENTNHPIDRSTHRQNILQGKNKWMIVHPCAPQSLLSDTHIGITGENLTILL